MQQTITVQKSEGRSRLRLAISTLQKHIQLIRVKEVLFLLTVTFGAALLRVPMQWAPSIEPLTFFAILAGWLFGATRGFAVGAGSLYLSNYLVFGGQGPWTLFQALGFGIAGFLGGQLRRRASYPEILLVTVVASVVFEAVVNIGSMTFLPFGLFSLFVSAIPFSAVHIISNILFSFGMRPARTLSERIGGFHELPIARQMMEKYKNKLRQFSSEKEVLRQ